VSKKAVKFYKLDAKKHGMGGLITTPPTRRKQDRRARPLEGYTVAFFPKINGIGPAYIHHHDFLISKTPKAAITKYMDRLAPTCTWAQMSAAGWKVRKIKVMDLGD
jgi:hypothetical protein